MGGEHVRSAWAHPSSGGSSPRGRGARLGEGADVAGPGLIPAWAGSTRAARGRGRVPLAHPRVGGEHRFSWSEHLRLAGSSPRGRGAQCRRCVRRAGDGLIPAWAGSTPRRVPALSSPRAHPRVGGEHRCALPSAVRVRGSSPRGRGAHPLGVAAVVRQGLIPAWAGSTRSRSRSSWRAGAHPRVGGEHPHGSSKTRFSKGSSPRGRGARQRRPAALQEPGLIPAWAGSTPSTRSPRATGWAHPRVGGEHRTVTCPVGLRPGSSPRGRGARSGEPGPVGPAGLIPAWAGSTLWSHSESPS